MAKTRLGVVWGILLLVGLSVLTADARAQGRAYRHWHRWPCSLYCGDYVRPYTFGHVPVPPYYALYPPVYYSYPVPRTYGYSPYAYPPGTRTPDTRSQGARVIHNKFVPKKTVPATTKHDGAVRAPLRITNPYVAQSNASRPADADAITTHQSGRPHVVFPVAATGQP